MVALRTGMRHRFRHSVYLQKQLLKMQEHRLTTGVDRRTRVRRIATESSRSEEAATVLYTQVSYAYPASAARTRLDSGAGHGVRHQSRDRRDFPVSASGPIVPVGQERKAPS